ncbi:MAG: hypothetical protein QWI73_06105 [Alphaproteobacteria bacterium]|nr:hypothetical protein [Alphaproteobacteria bacterium]
MFQHKCTLSSTGKTTLVCFASRFAASFSSSFFFDLFPPFSFAVFHTELAVMISVWANKEKNRKRKSESVERVHQRRSVGFSAQALPSIGNVIYWQSSSSSAGYAVPQGQISARTGKKEFEKENRHAIR